MAEHRRSMLALGRASDSAAVVARSTGSRHLQVVPGSGAEVERAEPASTTENVVSIAVLRARRAGHPAGGGRDR